MKRCVEEHVTIDTAVKQMQTHQAQIPSLFHYNEVLAVSDGTNARIGSLTAHQEWLKACRIPRR